MSDKYMSKQEICVHHKSTDITLGDCNMGREISGMSSNLIWKPVIQDGHGLSDELKFAMRKRHGSNIDVRLGRQSIAYLNGLYDAGINDAKVLIDAIEKHTEIDVKEEY